MLHSSPPGAQLPAGALLRDPRHRPRLRPAQEEEGAAHAALHARAQVLQEPQAVGL